jgi:ubiquinone/menaquinone biosynthesis C-methylase UbiE
MPKRIDYERMATSYEAGRDVAAEGLGAWRTAIEPFVPAGARIADVGAGTGLFARALVSWFDDATVVGIEPSEAMRTKAEAKGPHPRIEYREGAAEDLPQTAGSIDVAWLSAVIHHVDVAATALSLSRAIVPGGHALIRGAWPGRIDRITLFRYFPSAAAMLERTYPHLEAVVDIFKDVGLEFVSCTAVPQQTAASLVEFAEKVATRADSSLTRIPDEEFNAGLAALRQEAARATTGEPVVDWLDLVAFRRR